MEHPKILKEVTQMEKKKLLLNGVFHSVGNKTHDRD